MNASARDSHYRALTGDIPGSYDERYVFVIFSLQHCYNCAEITLQFAEIMRNLIPRKPLPKQSIIAAHRFQRDNEGKLSRVK